jgi:hypothetical protein
MALIECGERLDYFLIHISTHYPLNVEICFQDLVITRLEAAFRDFIATFLNEKANLARGTICPGNFVGRRFLVDSRIENVFDLLESAVLCTFENVVALEFVCNSGLKLKHKPLILTYVARS